jgi:P pilus assembly chaperone PapD
MSIRLERIPRPAGSSPARHAAPRGAVLLGLLALAATPGPVRAQMLAMVSPTQTSITVKPGEDASRDVTVSNLGAVPVRVRVRLSDWTLSERGEIGLAPVGSTAGTLLGAIQFSPAEFRLSPGESRHVGVTAGLTNTGMATRWGMLLCEVRSSAAASDEIGPRAATELGTTLFVSRIPPEEVHAEITGLAVTALGPDSIQITARVRNTGLRHLVVSGEAALADSGGVRLGGGTMTSGLVLPGASRVFQWSGHARTTPGGCLATATLDGGEPELLVGETRFVWRDAVAPTAAKTP